MQLIAGIKQILQLPVPVVIDLVNFAQDLPRKFDFPQADAFPVDQVQVIFIILNNYLHILFVIMIDNQMRFYGNGRIKLGLPDGLRLFFQCGIVFQVHIIQKLS